MVQLRIIRRYAGLYDLEILKIKDFSKDVTFDINRILDSGQQELVQRVTLSPKIGPLPPVPPLPIPTGTLIYDSNRDIDWANIDPTKKYTMYGSFVPNSGYIRAKASGNPYFLLNSEDKSICLIHSGKYGRLYFGVCNYESILECEFMLTNTSHNASFKDRCRHQFHDIDDTASLIRCQGGQGSSYAIDSIDADLEIAHDAGEVQGPNAKYPKLSINKYYKMRFSQFDDDGKIHVIDELDRGDGNGYQIINEGSINAPRQFFNKQEFLDWSEFWLRGNMDDGGKMYFKNIKMYAINK